VHRTNPLHEDQEQSSFYEVQTTISYVMPSVTTSETSDFPEESIPHTNASQVDTISSQSIYSLVNKKRGTSSKPGGESFQRPNVMVQNAAYVDVTPEQTTSLQEGDIYGNHAVVQRFERDRMESVGMSMSVIEQERSRSRLTTVVKDADPAATLAQAVLRFDQPTAESQEMYVPIAMQASQPALYAVTSQEPQALYAIPESVSSRDRKETITLSTLDELGTLSSRPTKDASAEEDGFGFSSEMYEAPSGNMSHAAETIYAPVEQDDTYAVHQPTILLDRGDGQVTVHRGMTRDQSERALVSIRSSMASGDVHVYLLRDRGDGASSALSILLPDGGFVHNLISPGIGGFFTINGKETHARTLAAAVAHSLEQLGAANGHCVSLAEIEEMDA
jgi:hypothetical protein